MDPPEGPRWKDAMRTLIIGDIHGCFDELLRLVARAGLSGEDLIVSVGDMVDRGPRSFDVVKFFQEDPVHRKALLGNHEEKHLRGTRPEAGDPSGRILKRTMSATDYQRMVASFAALPTYLELAEATVVHAGMIAGKSLSEQPSAVLTGRGSQGRPGFDHCSTWWFDEPAFCWPKPVVFGHTIFRTVARGTRNNVWGLDTGASQGGRLTGLLLPEFSLIEEPTHDYYAEALERWRPVFLQEDLPEMGWKAVLAVDVEKLPSAVAAEVLAARELLSHTMSQISAEAAELREQTHYKTLEPAERAALAKMLRDDPRFAGARGRAVLKALPSGLTEESFQKMFPKPSALRAALQE